MDAQRKGRLQRIRGELSENLKQVADFWLERGVDERHGGYLTNLDARGRLDASDTDKYIVTQTRMIWGLSLFAGLFPDEPGFGAAARQGVDFFIQHFWDRKHGGWVWKTARDGSLLDAGKVVYGQSFAVYALSQHTLSLGDARGVEYASRTFDLLQRYCADTARGGYYENLEPGWKLSEPGFAAGDRKSLDIHMHLLEAFTTLLAATQLEIHRRRLEEVIYLILRRMVDPEASCGLNQFDLEFNPIPPIAIRRTWNAEREGDLLVEAEDTTSYGHNLELVWLLLRALEVMGLPPDTHLEAVRGLGEHALQYGVDWERGGVYRDGPHQGPAVVRDKEWWQQTEALVGLLDGYLLLGDERYLDAFEKTWEFARRYFIHPELGEWRTLLTERGEPLVESLGNPWKACYHSGRGVYEAGLRLDRILK